MASPLVARKLLQLFPFRKGYRLFDFMRMPRTHHVMVRIEPGVRNVYSDRVSLYFPRDTITKENMATLAINLWV
jgi:hypothetical protein